MNRVLKFDEIAGYKVEGSFIYVLPNITGKKRIRITTYVGQSHELIEWLDARFQDLHVENEKEEVRAILEDYRHGRSEYERADKLKRAKATATVLNWLGGGSMRVDIVFGLSVSLRNASGNHGSPGFRCQFGSVPL